MKVLIIEEKDIKALEKSLELQKFKLQGKQTPEDEIYRRFNFVIQNWLRDQGR